MKTFEKQIQSMKLPCCGYEVRDGQIGPVHANPGNGVVQCHSCGHVYAASPAAQPVKHKGLAAPHVCGMVGVNCGTCAECAEIWQKQAAQPVDAIAAAEAMREAAAKVCEARNNHLLLEPSEAAQGMELESKACAEAIRALPLADIIQKVTHGQ